MSVGSAKEARLVSTKKIEMKVGIERAEEELFSEASYAESPPSDIVSFNELRSCSDLKRMASTDQLIIRPDFQRDLVWNPAAQSRFIDSLVKQLPIPSMCISLDYETDERQVIDGLQRMSSIIRFLSDSKWRLSKLADIDQKLSGKTVAQIKQENPHLYKRVENAVIPINVIRCNYRKKSHLDYLYTIFHRLNSGGSKLTNQEIRNCIYSGEFNEFLKAVVQKEQFRKLLKLKVGNSYRYSYEELILRVVVFSKYLDKYDGKLSQFLNDKMGQMQHMNNDEIELYAKRFDDVLSCLSSGVALKSGKLPSMSKTVLESLLLAIYANLPQCLDEANGSLREKFLDLISDELFSKEKLSEGLAAKEKLISRHRRAIEIFS